MVYVLQLHVLGSPFLPLEPLDTCMFIWLKIKTENRKKQKNRKVRNSQRVAHLPACFPALKHFSKMDQKYFLEVLNLVIIYQFEFFHLDLIY